MHQSVGVKTKPKKIDLHKEKTKKQTKPLEEKKCTKDSGKGEKDSGNFERKPG